LTGDAERASDLASQLFAIAPGSFEELETWPNEP
jgi:hypothetical protein